jgi:ABC-2 type transport system permease protein
VNATRILAIGWANLLRQGRDRSNFFFVFILPTIIIVALGIQFSGTQRARLGVVLPPSDAFATALIEELRASDVRLEVRILPTEAELRAAVERGQLEIGVVIPDGYGEAVRGATPARVQFLGTPESFTAGIRAPVEAAIARQAALVTAGRAAAAVGAGTFEDAAGRAPDLVDDVGGVEVAVTQVGTAGPFAGFGQFTLGAQSQLVLFMFLSSMTAAAALVLTKRLGISRRMLSTPTPIAVIVVGEGLGRFLIAMVQGLYIVAVSWLVFGVSWGDPLAAALIVVAFGVVAAAFALLVGAIASNADQAGSLGVFLGLALGALGGCMIPISFMPPVMQQLARLLPHSWALDGLQSLVRDGGGLASVLPNLGVLAAYGAVVLALAAWRFRKAIAG